MLHVFISHIDRCFVQSSPQKWTPFNPLCMYNLYTYITISVCTSTCAYILCTVTSTLHHSICTYYLSTMTSAHHHSICTTTSTTYTTTSTHCVHTPPTLQPLYTVKTTVLIAHLIWCAEHFPIRTPLMVCYSHHCVWKAHLLWCDMNTNRGVSSTLLKV